MFGACTGNGDCGVLAALANDSMNHETVLFKNDASCGMLNPHSLRSLLEAMPSSTS